MSKTMVSCSIRSVLGLMRRIRRELGVVVLGITGWDKNSSAVVVFGFKEALEIRRIAGFRWNTH